MFPVQFTSGLDCQLFISVTDRLSDLSPCRKYEEIFPPELNEFVYVTDSTYTKRQLVQMEHVFLRVLAFRMTAPTANQFLRLFMSVHSVCSTTENLALVSEINH